MTPGERFHELVLQFGRLKSLRDPVLSMGSCDLELTIPQMHALVWLHEDGPLTMGLLARRVGVTEKTATGLVDRLEREGYVQRERDESDRRVVRAVLTPAGKATGLRLRKDMDAHLDEFLACLDEQERQTLVGILENILRRLEAATATAPGRGT